MNHFSKEQKSKPNVCGVMKTMNLKSIFSSLIQSPLSYLGSKSNIIKASILVFCLLPFHAEARKKIVVPDVKLTPKGRQHLNEYSKEMEQLKSEILRSLPKLDNAKKSAYVKAREIEATTISTLRIAKQGKADITRWRKHINDFNVKWIPLSEKEVENAKKALLEAKTTEEKASAKSLLAKAEKGLVRTKAELVGRHKRLEKALKKHPNNEEVLKKAEALLPEAELKTKAMLKSLNAYEALESDKLDGKLATYYIMHHIGAKGLAGYAQKGPDEKMTIDEMLKDKELLIEMAIADGANQAQYGRAMEILKSIQKHQSNSTVTPALKRLALAVALELAVPRKLRNAVGDPNPQEFVNPLNRYITYEKAFLEKKLDPGFDNLSVWEMRMIVNGEEPDHIAEWAREMLANYRPDHILTADERWRYVDIVRTDIRYGSQDNKFDQDELQFFQNILKNGGICGRRAFMGRFILRAFGVPVTGRPQPGHAALTHWTSEGWVVCLGAGWGKGTTHTPYKQDLDFLATTQARAMGDTYKQVARGHWIGSVFGETRSFGFLTDKGNTAFWNAIALYKQRDLIKNAKALAAVGEDIGEANETKEKVEIIKVKLTDQDREIKVTDNGEIIIPAAATSNIKMSTKKVIFMPSNQGGLQLHYSRSHDPQPLEYTFSITKAGEYNLSARVVTPSWKQKLMISANGEGDEVELELPHTVGMWADTDPVKVKLKAGENILKFNHKTEGYEKGFSIHQFKLTPTK